jgi:hypothetical protein
MARVAVRTRWEAVEKLVVIPGWARVAAKS